MLPQLFSGLHFIICKVMVSHEKGHLFEHQQKNVTILLLLCANHMKFEEDHHFGKLVEKLDFGNFKMCCKTQHFEQALLYT